MKNIRENIRPIIKESVIVSTYHILEPPRNITYKMFWSIKSDIREVVFEEVSLCDIYYIINSRDKLHLI
jgi:hypothetical protein